MPIQTTHIEQSRWRQAVTEPRIPPLPIRVTPHSPHQVRVWMVFLKACPPWSVSLGVHIAVVLILAVATFPLETHKGQQIYVASVPDVTLDEEPYAMSFQATSAEALSQISEARSASISRRNPERLLNVKVSKPIVSMAGNSAETFTGTAVDELRRLLSGPPLHVKQAASKGSSTEFFGIRASGDQFVFVVDSSRSMMWRRWNRACRELTRSIEQLGEHQSFCVLFFDAQAHLMFRQSPDELRLIPATDRNRTRLKRWITSIEFGSDTRPYAAVRHAIRLNPDAIFLLSDGEFHDETLIFLRQSHRYQGDGPDGARSVIHTVGFSSQSGQGTLRAIADENGGTYRFVP